MAGPLDGIRVLEVAMYGFVPSAGAVLSDWGADVIKVEHAVTGDPQRGLRQVGAYKVAGEPNPSTRRTRHCSTRWHPLGRLRWPTPTSMPRSNGRRTNSR